MKHPRSKITATCRAATRTQKTLLPLVAVGGSLAGLPASALELADMNVQSRLGQPLRASIAYVLGPQETIAETCVSLGTGAPQSGLPGIGPATLSVADGIILLTGKVPVREPMVSTQVFINCPYTAKLSREYTLFIDPADRAIASTSAAANTAARRPVAAAPASAPAAAAPPRQPAAKAPAQPSIATPTPRKPAARSVQRAPIDKSSRYRVQPGDSLSQIAERIQNRPIGLWSAVDVIFRANPEAFINNDPNKLMAGSWLTIPSFDGSAPVVAASADNSSASAQGSAEPVAEVNVVELVPDVQADANLAPVVPEEPADSAAAEIAEIVVVDVTADASNDLSPADVVPETDNPFVDSVPAGNENIVIPDTELEGPTTTSSSPNVPTAVIQTSTQESSSPWLLWLAGAGLAIIIGLLLFGRRLRASNAPLVAPRYDDADARPFDLARDAMDDAAPVVAVIDDEPTEENLALDANLAVGASLGAGTEMDAAQDFGFASPTTVDFELPPQPDSPEDEPILNSEVLPEDEDYDLSVIIDATKMPRPEDITHRDLKAIEVHDETETSGSYTINKEVDFDILAQDYEDEFTATQAVNTEISRAAEDLVRNLGKDSTDAWMTTEETVLMTEEEETAMMEAQEDDDAALDATAEMTLGTAEMPLGNAQTGQFDDDLSIEETGTIERLLAEDYTLEMAAAENDDDTREMELESDDTVDTKAL